MNDTIEQHLKEASITSGTATGLELLRIEYKSDNYWAANTYLIALKEIKDQSSRIAALEAQNARLVEALKGLLMVTSFWKGEDGWDETDDETYDIARALLSEVTQ